ncbi:UNVERIFIED_CONTAM: hypothetical protein K2H54_072306 [Gekko kuhli]
MGRAAVGLLRLGRASWAASLGAQERCVGLQRAGAGGPGALAGRLVVWEPGAPVFTAGLRRGAESGPAEERRLRALGAGFARVRRGGLLTFHGPGQLVAYPGIEVGLEEGQWLCNGHLGRGVHCGQHITSHGLALNCCTDLSWFDHIVPCGLEGKGVTSLSQALGRHVSVEEATGPFLDAFQEVFQCTLVDCEEP